MSPEITPDDLQPTDLPQIGEETVMTRVNPGSDGDEALRLQRNAIRRQARYLAEAAVMLAMSEPGSIAAEGSLVRFHDAIQELGLSHVVQVEVTDPIVRLKRERVRLGLTQRQVASLLQCSNAYLSRLENGERASEKAIERAKALLESGSMQAMAGSLATTVATGRETAQPADSLQIESDSDR
jgi:hypothetical protein